MSKTSTYIDILWDILWGILFFGSQIVILIFIVGAGMASKSDQEMKNPCNDIVDSANKITESVEIKKEPVHHSGWIQINE